MAGRGGVILPKLVDSGALTTELQGRLDRLNASVKVSLQRAAATATAESRARFDAGRSGRPFAEERKGRPTTKGTFSRMIDWKSDDDLAKLDIPALEGAYGDEGGSRGLWLINEIGTGARAMTGRGHWAGDRFQRDSYQRTKVKSQRGRALKFGLAWADERGTVQRADGGRFRQDQIVRLSPANYFSRGTKASPVTAHRVVIGKEIEGKHYIRDGGRAGFGQYRPEVAAAAREAFAGRRWKY